MRRKRTVIWIVIMLLPAVGWLAWHYSKSVEQRYFESHLNQFIKSGRKEVSLRELTNFEWERGCIRAIDYGEGNLPPYLKFSSENFMKGPSYKNVLNYSHVMESKIGLQKNNWAIYFMNKDSSYIFYPHQSFQHTPKFSCFGVDTALVKEDK